MIRVDNLYRHEDGGLYCLLIADAPMKHPTTGEWIPGVIYTGPDGLTRSTSRERWDDRFAPVAAIHPDKLNETELSMIRRSNPGDSDMDFIRVFESWHTSEMSMTGHMLELAVGAVLEKMYFVYADGSPTNTDMALLTITSEDLQRVLQNYEISKTAEPHGFTFRMTKSFPSEG